MPDEEEMVVSDYYADEDMEMEINPKDNHLDNFMNDVWDTISSHGWLILALSLVVLYLYYKIIQPAIDKWKLKKEEDEYAAKYLSDTEQAKRERERLEQSRKRFQENYEKEAALQREKMRLKEEQKKEEKKQELKLRRLGSSNDEDGSQKKDLKRRIDYNPLSGAGSLPSYRPLRRSPCSGGRCG